MARYYFDVFDGSAVFRDDHGDAFGSLDEVADQAIGVLADVAWDKLQNRQGQDFAVVVRDDERDVYRAALIFRDSYPDPETASGPQDVCPMVSVSDPADLILRSRETRATSERLVRRVRDTATDLSDTVRQTLEILQSTRAAAARMA